ncbi:peptidyl-tRNA hydrolase domain protein [Aspergillus undulatus]|uniref:peptidyl-tRNA hydrolase domain protein n=1 Tax=Aspergillus undulatus TaxID=1810928 RepID=UPI003CCD95BC
MFRTLLSSPFLRYSVPFRRSFASRWADVPEEELAAAREWLSKLNSTTIPRHVGEISFSRSGGPGGQNVNKVNSKATLKVPLESLLPLVPHIIHSPLQTSRYYAARTNSLVIQSEESRKQSDNVEACYDKLHKLLEHSATSVVPGETLPETRERSKRLSKAGTEARIRDKKKNSSKKESRRGSRDDE